MPSSDFPAEIFASRGARGLREAFGRVGPTVMVAAIDHSVLDLIGVSSPGAHPVAAGAITWR